MKYDWDKKCDLSLGLMKAHGFCYCFLKHAARSHAQKAVSVQVHFRIKACLIEKHAEIVEETMKLPSVVIDFINRPYSHYVISFTAGAGLELFMNLFHVGEISIYNSIKKNLSTQKAEQLFEAEKALFERIQASSVSDEED